MSKQLYRALVEAGASENLAADAADNLDNRAADIAKSHSEMAVKSEVFKMESQFVELTGKIDVLGERTTRLETDVAELKADVKELKSDVAEIKVELAKMEVRLLIRLLVIQSIFVGIATFVALAI